MRRIRYHVRHDTLYRYDQPVGESHQLLRLLPRTLAWQESIAHSVEVCPEPSRAKNFVDPFGNRVRALHFEADHDELSIRSEVWIDLMSRPMPDMAASPPWDTVRESLRYKAGHSISREMLEAATFRYESTYIRLKRDFADYARASFPPGTPLLVGVEALMRRIFAEFKFEPGATDVSTPVTTVFTSRRGVCQDFAHFMISCLRSLGLPARYVSGYLLTRPAAGKKRLIGADATHAWVSVFCPGTGWVDFDPTNALLPDLEHITIGWGRDFGDISPVRGVIIGGGGHEPEIAVTVVPEDEFASVYGAADDLPFELRPTPACSA